ncbi:hypothetical protein [Umezawaea sp.]|uniref:hypothetical protein n=1 Tax=Umezawaea sp. TaxID=1955258 RepID=UPI002ED68C57
MHGAIAHHLPAVHALAHDPPPLAELVSRISEVHPRAAAPHATSSVPGPHSRTTSPDPSTAATTRLVTPITRAVSRRP